MQLPPCAPAVLSYDICFSSLSRTIGLFVRDLALRGSDDFLVFVQCSFSSWHYVVFLFFLIFFGMMFFFFVSALLHTNHIFHLSACTSTRVYIVLHLQLCAFDAVCCVCGGSHCGCPISVTLHQSKKNQKGVFWRKTKHLPKRHSQNNKTLHLFFLYFHRCLFDFWSVFIWSCVRVQLEVKSLFVKFFFFLIHDIVVVCDYNKHVWHVI